MSWPTRLGWTSSASGEHHRPDFAVSAPEVVLAAIAAKTKRIRLGSAVTVLSSDDPVRVFERFSTLNALSNGRAEVIVGRGSFTESFPLFGYDMANYEELFEEKLDLFAELLKQQPITWKGRLRAPLTTHGLSPDRRAALHVGGGGRQPRVGGAGRALRPAADAGDHRREPGAVRAVLAAVSRALEQFGKPPQPIGAHSPGHIAETDEQANDELWPHYAGLMNRIGRERGWPPIGRDHFEREAGDGALFVGSPRRWPRKIVAYRQGARPVALRPEVQHGTLPHEQLMKSIELYGTKVVPLVREQLGLGAV